MDFQNRICSGRLESAGVLWLLRTGYKAEKVIDRIFKSTRNKDTKLATLLYTLPFFEWWWAKHKIYGHFHFILWRKPIKFEKKIRWKWAKRMRRVSSSCTRVPPRTCVWMSVCVYMSAGMWVLICILYENSFKYLLRCFALFKCNLMSLQVEYNKSSSLTHTHTHTKKERVETEREREGDRKFSK